MTAFVVAMLIFCGASSMSAQDKDIKGLAGAFAENLSKMSKKTVAVVDFNDLQGNITELGRYLAEQVSVALAMTNKGIEVVDRSHLKTLLQEYKLSSSGIIDPATARKLGQIAGVEILVTGTLTPFGDSVQLAIKALDTTTARIVTASTVDIAKTKAIDELLSRGVTPGQSSPGVSLQASSSLNATGMIIEVQQFRFALKSCKLAGDALTCTTLVTNRNEQDRQLHVNAECSPVSRAIDESGAEYIAKRAWIGSRGDGCTTTNTMTSGIPTIVDLRFEGLRSSVLQLSLLEVSCSIDNRQFKAQLRNVPVSR